MPTTETTETKTDTAAPAKKQTPFARFFRSVPGHIVSRYGTATQTTSNQRIGCRRVRREIPGRENDLIGDSSLEWHDEVVALTEDEARIFKREYDGHVADKALVELTEADYVAYLEREAKASATAELEKASGDASAPSDASTSSRGDASSDVVGDASAAAAPPTLPPGVAPPNSATAAPGSDTK